MWKKIIPNDKSLKRTIVLSLVIALVFGLAAGIVGQIFAQKFIFNYLGESDELVKLNNNFYDLLAKYNFLNQENSDQSLEIVIRQSQNNQEANSVARQVTVGGWLDGLKQSTVNFFQYREVSSKDVLLSAYRSEDSLGRGVILTNDGWIITTKQVLSKTKGQYVAIGEKGDVYEIEKIITDPMTPVAFAKVSASNLVVLGFDKKINVSPGQTVLALDKNKGIKTSLLENINYRANKTNKDLIESAEILDSYYLPESDFEKVALGEAVTDQNGKLIGLVYALDGENVVLPLLNFSNKIDEALKNGKISRVKIGISYLDLGQMMINPEVEKKYQGLRRGVLVYKNISLGAIGVEKGSPAQKAGLQIGDVILKVEGEEINSENIFSRMIQEYGVGTVVELTVWREGREERINVTLEEFV
ncbi:MAG: PDZ domain-containing protein [Patescibacteria group bacterium]|jgi:serine protease Do